MGVNLRQVDDGSLRFENDADGVADLHIGGPKVPSSANPRRLAVRVLKMPLAAVDTAGGVLSWVNNTGGDVLVDGLLLDVTTQSSGACTLSAGTTAVSGTTSSANLIDTLSVAAAGLFDNITDKGTNGKSRQKIAANTWFTVSKATGATAGLVGSAYLFILPA